MSESSVGVSVGSCSSGSVPAGGVGSCSEVSAARGEGFRVELGAYRQAYQDLYALYEKLQAAKVEVIEAKAKVEAAQPGGQLVEVQQGWTNACQAAVKLEENVVKLEGMVNRVLRGLVESHAAYAQAEAQGRAGLARVGVDAQTKQSFEWKEKDDL
ncbi:hypothetical protein [Austwickia chelonae]|uniref:Uncharacterized protein n=1 Tax=Austwickia chelonae NBRC 105200 TaxID=1184607 RepID=K6WCD4_9MICO|nr:hypothetical protein [Austwickia chelonae]GAB79482.1 hypothetical protein AUCHE_29_00020 [Austwickia chelonae NBRC 105200]